MNQSKIYETVKKKPGITAKQISQTTKMRYNNVSRMLRQLVYYGYLKQRPNNTNGKYANCKYTYFASTEYDKS